jgi:inner membrane protein
MTTSDRAGSRARQEVLRAPARPAARVLLCAAGLAVIGVLDLIARWRDWPIPVIGALDEPAHLATAGLLLVAFLPWRARAVVPWALAGAVLIDLDHIPFYLWGALTTGDAGRPLTHSLVTAVVLAVIGLLLRNRARTALLGLALGVLLHLVRDLGTGPGVPLFWPLSSESALLPYWVYFGAMTAVTVLAAVRCCVAGPAAQPGRPSDASA